MGFLFDGAKSLGFPPITREFQFGVYGLNSALTWGDLLPYTYVILVFSSTYFLNKLLSIFIKKIVSEEYLTCFNLMLL
jgi:hypothetical protein